LRGRLTDLALRLAIDLIEPASCRFENRLREGVGMRLHLMPFTEER
jgi:hypothetical protein